MTKKSDFEKLGKYLEENREELNRKGLMLHAGHKRPTTRRELLAAGFYTSALTMILPSFPGLLSATKALAEGETCNLEPNVNGVPLLQAHFRGGRALFGNGVAIGLNGHGAPEDYTSNGASTNTDFFEYGLHPDHHPSVSPYVSLGGHAMSSTSYIWNSAQEVFGPPGSPGFEALQKKLGLISFCASSNDDNASTPQNILPYATRIRGKSHFNILSNTAGTDNNGLENVPFIAGLMTKANAVQGSISNLVDTGLDFVDVSARKAFMQALTKVVDLKRYDAQTKAILGCSNQGAVKKIEQYAQEIDPFQLDAAIANNFAANEADDAIISYMLKENLSLAGGINMGGYDYHGNGTAGYMRDYQGWLRIWKHVKYFMDSGKPLIVFTTSDGSTDCNNLEMPLTAMINGVETEISHGAPTGDHGLNGGALMLVLAGDEHPLPPIKHYQVGYGNRKKNVKGPIAEDSKAYGLVAIETMVRFMCHLTGGALSGVDISNATEDTQRFPAELEFCVPVDKV